MVYENDIQACVKTFLQNGIILYPTDTVWGLGCAADDEVAIQKIIELKKRPAHKNFILLMTDVKQLSKYIANPIPDLETILNQFEIPTTVIYDNAINLPNSVVANDGSIAVRITKDAFCRSLIKRIRKPIVSTSANFSEEVTPAIFSEINPKIINHVDYVVKYRQDDFQKNSPSNLLKLQPNGDFIKIR